MSKPHQSCLAAALAYRSNARRRSFLCHPRLEMLEDRRMLSGIQGQTWRDENGDGVWDVDERAIAGVPIYLDLNKDGACQAGEPITASRSDDPTTEMDETGLYDFSVLAPAIYVVRQMPPDGFVQSYPPGNASHVLELVDDGIDARADFAIRVTPGSITGLVWTDENRNGIRDEGEWTLSSVVVQLVDEHLNAVATTSTDRRGCYEFTGLVPGQYSMSVPRRQTLQFTLQDIPGSDEYDSDPDPLSGRTSGVKVASGAVVRNLDAGVYSEHQNPANKLDVNGDGDVSPFDALVVINWLNARAEIVPSDAPPYRDVSGDGDISPLDALHVINHWTASKPPDPEAPHVPVLLSPSDGTLVSTSTVTLSFQPLADYVGDYFVRLDDQQWDGEQAAGFQHDSRAYYLCLLTKQTSVTVPVRTGHTYRWWVNKPDFDAAEATFVVEGIDLRLIPNAPPVDQVFPPELIDGRYRATAMRQWSNRQVDVSGALQQWIDQLPVGATLELPAGKYLVNNQITINHRITLTSTGKLLGDPTCEESAGDCAELIATPALNQPFGILRINQLEALHHIVLNGNKQGRQGTLAYQNCASGQDSRYGFNARLTCDNCIIAGNIFKNALGGTGLEVAGSRVSVEIRSNLFAYNGVHTTRNLWADGLTVHDLRDLP